MLRYLIISGILLLNVVATYQTANAQTHPVFYRFEIPLSNNTLRTLAIEDGAVVSRLLANLNSGTHLSERFILKQKDGNLYIASATDQRLFLKRSGNTVVLSEMNNTSNPAYDFKWKIIYANDGKGCITSGNLGQLLKITPEGKVKVIPFGNGQYGNVKFTITKIVKNL
jgi:hypothetical protein